MNEVICESPSAVLLKLQEMVHLDASRKVRSNNKAVSKSTEEGAASALMHESSKGRKGKGRRLQKLRCEPAKPAENGKPGEPGKHNPAVTSHDADHCWQLHPELRPTSWGNSSSEYTPATQLVEVDDGHESEVSMLLVETATKPIVMDTGATHHMVNDPAIFMPHSKTNIQISTGGHKNFLNATAVGSAVLVNQDGKKLVRENVLLVPALNRCLLSVPRIFEEKLVLNKSENDAVMVTIDGNFEIQGTVKNNLLELPTSHFAEIKTNSSCFLSSAISPDWHERLGHPHPKYQQMLVPHSKIKDCEVCKLCKLKTLPFHSNFKKVEAVLEAVHMDLVGPFSTKSTTGYQYFLTLVDQYSGFKVVKFLKSKGEAFEAFIGFKVKAETQTGQRLRTIISDGGGEFINKRFATACESDGIAHHISPAYTPQNNGMAERTNQTILVKARCLLVQSRLPKSFWAEAVNTATHLANLTPSATRNNKIPYETWTGRTCNLEVLRPFGCSTYSLIPKEQRIFKLLPTAERGIMLGYENDFSSYRVYKLATKKVFSIRNVKFDEAVFPGLVGQPSITDEDFNDMDDETQDPADVLPEPVSNPEPIPTSPEPCPAAISEAPRESNQDSVRLAPKDISSAISTDNILSVDRRGNSILVYLAENETDNTPLSYIQALNSANSSFWKKAVEKEITNMESHDVWIIVKKEDGLKCINCTWVFKIKKDQLNVPIEYKARLCAQGFQQVKGKDYFATYAPTGKMVSLRMLIIHALEHDLLFHQIDIKSAFLNAPLEEDIYVNPPPGVNVPPGHVLKLQKAMKGTFLYLHVDDLAIFSKDPEVFKTEVRSKFQIKDLRESTLLLGMNVTQETGSVTLSQGHYIDSELERFGIQHLYPASTPMKPGGHLVKASKAERIALLESGKNYRSLVGALNYLSVTTRPDITFAVSTLSQHLNRPGTLHWEAGIQVFRYLKGTRDIGLKFNKTQRGLNSLVGYADADWASCPESRRSVSGNLVLLNGNVISWKSKKQPTLSLSSTEAEYKSLGDITKEIMWVKTLLKKVFNVKIPGPTKIYDDNQGAIALANDASNHSNYKTKHMALRHHFIRREIRIKTIELEYVPSNRMLADFLTKAVGKISIKRALQGLHLLCSSPKRH
ncbi:hypothetical protein MJO28_007602 [Puccinia striiformis f. sp. tritici]|uniref:Uncharacterized protein n=1 Tax=Puccinia striiformis f. sp. tritici TaxID=168172 RepID=A0ACC0EEC1_9BASI|nr:hypothetical protein MJO28_007602 [Puccinia striiformis f. sp. tritici]